MNMYVIYMNLRMLGRKLGKFLFQLFQAFLELLDGKGRGCFGSDRGCILSRCRCRCWGCGCGCGCGRFCRRLFLLLKPHDNLSSFGSMVDNQSCRHREQHVYRLSQHCAHRRCPRVPRYSSQNAAFRRSGSFLYLHWMFLRGCQYESIENECGPQVSPPSYAAADQVSVKLSTHYMGTKGESFL